jgi:hypothetical protein
MPKQYPSCDMRSHAVSENVSSWGRSAAQAHASEDFPQMHVTESWLSRRRVVPRTPSVFRQSLLVTRQSATAALNGLAEPTGLLGRWLTEIDFGPAARSYEGGAGAPGDGG